MRVVLAIVVGLTCPLAAAAQPAGDRYGPASPLQVREASAAAYQGRALSWANKQVAPQAPQPQQPPQQQRAQAPALPPPPSRYQPPAPAYVPFQPQVPLPLQQPPAPAKAVQAPPTSIYGVSAPATPQPAAPARLATAPAAVPAAAPSPKPQRLAQAAPAQPALQRTAQPAPGGTPRLYSVHRDFGMTPDVIEPTKGDRYVLIGPPDAPTPKSKTEDDDDAPDARPGAF